MNVTVVPLIAVISTLSCCVESKYDGAMAMKSPTLQPDADFTVIDVLPADADEAILVQVVVGVYPYNSKIPVTTNSLVPAISGLITYPASPLAPVISNVIL